MDRLKLNTKALLGMATRTVDQDHGMRHTCVKSFSQAILQYENAMTKFVAALTTLSNSIEGVEKAYKDIIVNEKQVSVIDGMKEIVTRLEDVRLTVFAESVEAFKTTVAPSLSILKGECDTCDRIHIERAKAVDLYDYHRDVVEKKEVQYASKGKSLDDSKHYKEEVSKRDAANDEYQMKHTEYNKAYDQLMWRKSELTSLSAKLYLHCFSDLSEKLNRETVHMCSILDDISITPMNDEETRTLFSREVSPPVDAPEYDAKEEPSENGDSSPLVGNETSVGQPLATEYEAVNGNPEAVLVTEKK
ncbi:hypothetical protein DQ04_00431180 [Trypanosoma grayi]|uniref:hypothetical protein n=1 Tax=Trypanosoma grayi TaxID=71804 RepID=UPI0004F432C3|nr:hypothetical protein DQ04_00431180 [Trypanosoma grayi]KEG14514.1 hypothetical protein DQ04_00431180 [Trypanosoma grayi]